LPFCVGEVIAQISQQCFSFIIDYKTGNSQIAAWFDERPNEPQLPLYGISQAETAGLIFAQIRSGDMRIKGVGKASFEISGVKAIDEVKLAATDWDTQLKHWETVLTQLGQNFHNGLAQVDPKDNNTCQYCELPSLCRIAETALP